MDMTEISDAMRICTNMTILGKYAFYLKKLKINIIMYKIISMPLSMCTYFIFIVLISLKIHEQF